MINLRKNVKIISLKKPIKKKKNQKITIVTVVFNDEKNIGKTIENILSQKYKNIEYIIVVTPSEDKTINKILKYKSKIDKIIICKKRGIFTNMNVGAHYSTGKYINFMNSGDYFFDKKTIENIFKKKQNYDVIYGDCQMYYGSFLRFIKSKKIKYFDSEMIFSHQSAFVKTSMQKKYKFNIKYKLSADYDFFLKLLKQKKRFKYYPNIISKRLAYGISDRKMLSTIYENYLISKNYFHKNSYKRKLKLYKDIILYGLISAVKNLLPKVAIDKLIKITRT